MVATPTIWKAQHQVNLIDDADQSDAAIVDIGLGRYVAVWTEQDGGPIGSADGTDIIAQIFDAEGNPVGSAFQANHYFSADHERKAALASHPDGGFVIAYEDHNAAGTSIRVEHYDVDGNNLGYKSIQQDDGSDTISNPSIAMQADGSYLVTYQRSDNAGDTDIKGRIVDQSGVVGDEFFILSSTDDSTDAKAAVLSNGNYVVVCQDEFNGQSANLDIKYHVFSPTGATVALNLVAGGASLQHSPSVAALEGGGFAIVWADDEADGTDDQGIKARMYDDQGVPQGGAFSVNARTEGQQTDPVVTALNDGGFAVTWIDFGQDVMQGQRFDANGDPVGSEFVAGSEGWESTPVIAALKDGRFIAGFEQIKDDDDIHATIFDPRDKTIIGTGDDDVLTSRKDGATVDGKNGDDTLLGQEAKDELKGGKGDDILLGRGGKDRLIGDKGDDTLGGDAGNDKLIGGKGNDTLTGGDGKDKFVFDTKLNSGTNVDTVTDFQLNQDKVLLDEGIFGKIGGKLNAGEFRVGSKAKDGNDYVIYNDNNGKLYYDKNGDKSGGKTLFAILEDDLRLSHKDFDMI